MRQDTSVEKPSHVPDDRVVDFDIYNFSAPDGEYQLGLKAFADTAPAVVWTPHNGGHWMLTRADVIDRMLSQSENFSSNHITVPRQPEGMPKLMPLQIDPPDHKKYQLLIAHAMSPRAVMPLAERARTLAIELIDGFKDKGECEFVADFAQHLPIAIFMQLVDLPESDRPLLTGIAEIMLRSESVAERGQAAMQLAGYGMQKLGERRAEPGDDLISSLAQARIDGELLDDATLTGMIMLLLLAGLDTVASMLGFFARFLAEHPGHRRALIEQPALIPNALEELLRRFPIAVLAREVVRDVEIDGVTMKVGDMVAAPTPLAGLDARKFHDPETVDFNRARPMHATFGGGAHRCLGAMLARAELRVFLEEWLKRIPDFQVKPGAAIHVSARSVATLTSLPLVWANAVNKGVPASAA